LIIFPLKKKKKKTKKRPEKFQRFEKTINFAERQTEEGKD